MMNIDEIDNDIVRQLENNGLKKGDREQRIKLLLTHAYMAIRMYWAMSPEDRVLTSEWHKKFKRSFSLKKFLKERKRNRERKIPPCTPLIKKGHLEKGTKTSQCAGQEFHDLSERQMAFWMELEEYIGKYDRQTILRFFYYWAEEDKRTGKMKYETQSSWNTKYRLAIWSKRSYEVNDQAAELRLAKAKGKQQAANQQTMTAERDDNNARLEQEIAERKASAVSYEEWLKMKK
jgi:hypothetical protein